MLVNTYHITKDGHVSGITLKSHTPPTIAKENADKPIPDLFARIQSELSLDILSRKLVIGIGVGTLTCEESTIKDAKNARSNSIPSELHLLNRPSKNTRPANGQLLVLRRILTTLFL